MAERRFARLVFAITLMSAAPLYGGAFEFHWPGARAGGMGGACVAAIDPTAVRCNPGALALLPKKKGAAVGLAATAFNESLYQGLPPGIGAGTASEQKTPLGIVPHAYVTLPFPLMANSVLGLGIDSPYRMHTEWNDPDAFAGRFLASKSEIDSLDLTTELSVPLGKSMGIGGGIVYRSSSLKVDRRVAATSGGTQREFASLSMKTDTERAIGWTAGFLIKAGNTLSLGAAYHSTIKTEYTGAGTLTQIPTGDAQFDQLVRASFQFGEDLPVTTELRFPAQTTFGVAWSPSRAWLFALDMDRNQWNKTGDVDVVFVSEHSLDTSYPLQFETTWAYRAGMRLRFPTGPQVRFGYALEKSPQPDATVGAFLPDADRTTLTAGFGLDWLDVAVGYTTYKQRVVQTNIQQFNGNYRAKSWVAMLTVTK
jgi:long-chain fatty acid transport protein